jgi:hypothetical protein
LGFSENVTEERSADQGCQDTDWQFGWQVDPGNGVGAEHQDTAAQEAAGNQ